MLFRSKYFGAEVGAPVVDLWTDGGKGQVIGQAEILPVLLAKTTWSSDFTHRPCICFIDNNSARYSLMRGYSPILDSSRMISETWLIDARLAISSWYARVPTCCNIADDPSRLSFDVLRSLPNSRMYEISVPDEWGTGFLWSVVSKRLARVL